MMDGISSRKRNYQRSLKYKDKTSVSSSTDRDSFSDFSDSSLDHSVNKSNLNEIKSTDDNIESKIQVNILKINNENDIDDLSVTEGEFSISPILPNILVVVLYEIKGYERLVL